MVSDLANTLSTQSAHVLAAVYALSYVGSIYASKGARLSFPHTKAYLDFGCASLKAHHERWRDDPGVIRARLVAVSVVTMLCCVGATVLVRTLMGNETDVCYLRNRVLFVLTRSSRVAAFNSVSPDSRTSGFHFSFLPSFSYNASFVPRSAVRPLSWPGPSLSKELVIPRRCGFFFLFGHRHEELSGCTFVRLPSSLHVTTCQAPITEEVVFRACVLSGYYFAGASRSRMIFLSPMVFGAGEGCKPPS